jgi:hypothetical protein
MPDAGLSREEGNPENGSPYNTRSGDKLPEIRAAGERECDEWITDDPSAPFSPAGSLNA